MIYLILGLSLFLSTAILGIGSISGIAVGLYAGSENYSRQLEANTNHIDIDLGPLPEEIRSFNPQIISVSESLIDNMKGLEKQVMKERKTNKGKARKARIFNQIKGGVSYVLGGGNNGCKPYSEYE